jgi:hypothetical protein
MCYVSLFTINFINKDPILRFAVVGGVHYINSAKTKQTFKMSTFTQECMQETNAFLSKKYSGLVTSMEVVRKEDLDLANHLVGLKQTFLKLSFLTTTDLNKVSLPRND